jgi:hypothetical protein
MVEKGMMCWELPKVIAESRILEDQFCTGTRWVLSVIRIYHQLTCRAQRAKSL